MCIRVILFADKLIFQLLFFNKYLTSGERFIEKKNSFYSKKNVVVGCDSVQNFDSRNCELCY